MSWNAPTTVAEMTESTRRRWSWHSSRCDLAAESVWVLSASGMARYLDRTHPLTDHVLTGAERHRDDYMSTGSRDYHPSVVTYYVWDRRTGRVVLAVQADGTVLDELAEQRPDMRPATRDALRDAIA